LRIKATPAWKYVTKHIADKRPPYRSYYEERKAEAREVALEYQQRGLPLIVVCPAHVVGPNDHSA
jgi:hypothetical protein